MKCNIKCIENVKMLSFRDFQNRMIRKDNNSGKQKETKRKHSVFELRKKRIVLCLKKKFPPKEYVCKRKEKRNDS